MPYIKTERRIDLLEIKLKDLIAKPWRYLEGAGDLTFILSSIVTQAFRQNKKYETAAMLLGTLSAVSQELYRREIAPYENGKIIENGDI
jgi:hypothetical protein